MAGSQARSPSNTGRQKHQETALAAAAERPITDAPQPSWTSEEEGWLHGKNGTRLSADEVSSALCGDAGRSRGSSTITRDASAGALTERELWATNAKLLKFDRQRRQFLADISHELRRPLTVIRGMAEVALRGEEKPLAEYQATLEHIVQLTTQANQLVEDLLLLARFESGSLQIDKRATSLSEIMTEVSQQGNLLARRKLLTLTLQCDKDVGSVQGDPQRLIQLFMIIIDNAVNYTEPGGAIDIQLAKDGDQGRVVITDTGIGIPAEDLSRVFERGYRVKQTGARAQPGTGLGLPIAKWITETHRGRISLTSTPGAGTRVTILLPLSGLVRV